MTPSCPGASDPEFFDGEVGVVAREALDTTDPALFLDTDAYLFGTPVNFGYLSGALKHSFDSTYDQLLDHVTGRPFSYWVHGRSGRDRRPTGHRRHHHRVVTAPGRRAIRTSRHAR